MKTEKNFVLKGDIIYSATPTELSIYPDSYLVCQENLVKGVFKELPQEYSHLNVHDYRGKLILPGFTDLHVHAPQFSFRGLGMDLELLDWLNTQTFPEEAKYNDIKYASKAYDQFVDALTQGGTTRAVIFGTVHVPATLLLMEKLEKTGMITMVGRVNMDRNCIDELCEKDAVTAVEDTRDWIKTSRESFERTTPILTPRFVPSCTDELMSGLGELQKEAGLCIQSHLSENQSEVEWVKDLVPESVNYADAYKQFGLLGDKELPAIMAHCVYLSKEERELLKEHGTYVAHCPISNTNLSSGIAPARRFVEEGINLGLGTDVAGGFSISMLRVVAETVLASKLYWRLIDQNDNALTMPEAFYLSTKGGGAYFGKVGSFEEGYEFDAIVLDDSDIPCPYDLKLEERLERVIYLGNDTNIVHKFVNGNMVK